MVVLLHYYSHKVAILMNLFTFRYLSIVSVYCWSLQNFIIYHPQPFDFKNSVHFSEERWHMDSVW